MASENYTEIFTKLETWLVSHKYVILNKSLNPNPRIIYNLAIHLPHDIMFYLNISLFENTNNYFLLTRDLRFEDSIIKSISSLPQGEREQLFMNIRKLIYPLFVNLEMRWPNMILLLKELTFESVKNNEQFFIDQVRNFRNAIELVKINFDEKHFALFPQGKKSSDDFR